MDYKKTNAPGSTVTRDMMELCADTGNVYETVSIIGKRANQISVEIKNDLSKKLAEFASYNDNLEEVFENREQIEKKNYDTTNSICLFIDCDRLADNCYVPAARAIYCFGRSYCICF